ncbi:MAG: DUF3472 domain-containing protein [Armatimonadetes bacterium]|nr:DUF3472 domain-containing protein [Armatimonadota bacterium]
MLTKLFFILALSLTAGLAAVADSFDALRVPGYTAYLEPNPEPSGMDVSAPDGVTGWSDAKTQVVWYGQIKAAGRLDLWVSLRLPAADRSRLRLTVAGQSRTAEAVGGPAPALVSFRTFSIPHPGPYRFALAGLSRTGPTFGDVDALLVGGPAARDAHFSQARTRGAPSVHLWYVTPKGANIAWCYNEVMVRDSPLWSYYMACGFSRGYFGIQVNSPTERRIIFSVWNAGDEPTDPNKVPQEDRVQLLAKGPGVFAGAFGNEGTGGHSHLVYPWKTGRTYCFLVSARPDGTATVYSGYVYFPEQKRWGLIASFRAPKDGGWLRGLYSFNEDFNGANGQQRRLAEFGPQWIKTADGHWTELLTAHFTHTADGTKERLDRAAGVVHDHFYLSNGGFVPSENVHYDDAFTRASSGHGPPDITLPQLP